MKLIDLASISYLPIPLLITSYTTNIILTQSNRNITLHINT